MATTAAVLAAPAIGRAQGRKLKLSHYLPPQHQINTELNRWADELKQKTDGALEIEVFPAGQMGPPPRQFDLARTGVADMAFVFTALVPGRFVLTEALSVPFLFANEQGKPVTTAEASFIGSSLRDKLAGDYKGTQALYSVVTTSGGFFMREKAVQKPDDLKGLRVRPTSTFAAAQITALGGSPATIPPAELADAMAKGVVDGAIFNFEGGKAFQLQQAVKKVTPLANSVGFFTLVANEDMLAGLPEELRKVIEETTGPEAGRRVGAIYDDAEKAGRDFMTGAGVEVIELDTKAIDAFRAPLEPPTEELLKSIEGKGLDVRGLIEDVKTRVAKV
jgi:TRAP-type C4-dicarboxylate transport system substrate-binding protein